WEADEAEEVLERTVATLSDLRGLVVNALVTRHWDPEPPRSGRYSSMGLDADPPVDHHPIESEPLQFGHDALRLLGSVISPRRVKVRRRVADGTSSGEDPRPEQLSARDSISNGQVPRGPA